MRTVPGYSVAIGSCAALAAALAFAVDTATKSTQDKYSLKVPGGLEFSEFRGYESWEAISFSQSDPFVALILGNPAMVNSLKEGIPDNGKPFPDGARMAKIHWSPKKQESYPGQPTVPGPQRDVDFMVKDSKRFADGGGWGYAAFLYDAASGTFSPAGLDAIVPQGNDARCGVACHTTVKNRDYVFTEYASR